MLATALLATGCTAASSLAPPSGSSSPSAPGSTRSPLIDAAKIISGGPPPGGIPPIDHPKFLAPGAADFLQPQEPVLAVEANGVSKAYPLRIMIWHEIVNDGFAGTPVVVTYCPLCDTGIAYLRPTVGGKLLDFGTSGKLHNSNLLMYDRQMNSYWSQALGEAVIGPLTGTKLTFVAARILSWGEWKAAYPDGLVLSTDTGISRPYGTNPYVNYDGQPQPFLFDGRVDPRLPAKEQVLGIGGPTPIAIPFSLLAARSSGGATVVQGAFGGIRLAVFWQSGTVSALDAAQIPQSADVGAAAAYLPDVGRQHVTFKVQHGTIVDEQTGTTWSIDGMGSNGPLAGSHLMVAAAINSYWFDWAAFHPATQVFGAR